MSFLCFVTASLFTPNLMLPPHFRCLAAPGSVWFPSSSSFSFSRILRESFMAVTPWSGRAKGKPVLRGLVFDMDGTLTVPAIDFSAMYKAVLGEEGYAASRSRKPGGSVDILHHIETLPPQEQQRAYEVIADYERQGLDRLQIMPGATDLCEYTDSKQLRRGLITRNVKASIDLFHKKFGLKFFPALGREFRPYKPNPAPLLHICSSWGIPPNEVMMIGDSLRDDVTCGKQAGAFTCLLNQTGRYGPIDSLQDPKPDFMVSSLTEVQSLLDANFELLPHPSTLES